MRHLLCMATIFIVSFCYCQQNKSAVEKWGSHSIPWYRDTLIAYNNSNEEWTVFLKDSRVFATTEKMIMGGVLPFKPIFDRFDTIPVRGKISAIEVDGGFLAGLDNGEWGGVLYWFSNDGESKYRVSYGNIVQLIPRGNKIYAIEGLAHLGISFGDVIQI